ncbi:MAG: copper resistance protein NlpE [Campylobacter sp.]|nr:copper resistance protein NlpE [Campylobacter sp.]
MKRKILLFLAILSIFTACAKDQPDSSTCDATCKAEIPKFFGVYKAKIPCENDCKGTNATLWLNQDGTYKLEFAFITPDSETETQSGKYEVSKDFITVTNRYQEVRKFKILANSLLMIDEEKNLSHEFKKIK